MVRTDHSYITAFQRGDQFFLPLFFECLGAGMVAKEKTAGTRVENRTAHERGAPNFAIKWTGPLSHRLNAIEVLCSCLQVPTVMPQTLPRT